MASKPYPLTYADGKKLKVSEETIDLMNAFRDGGDWHPPDVGLLPDAYQANPPKHLWDFVEMVLEVFAENEETISAQADRIAELEARGCFFTGPEYLAKPEGFTKEQAISELYSTKADRQQDAVTTTLVATAGGAYDQAEQQKLVDLILTLTDKLNRMNGYSA